MSLERAFGSIAQFADFLEVNAAKAIPMGEVLAAAAGKTLLRKTKARYGDKVLTELADATQDDRAAKGYSRDEPLLRDGSLLRDSIEMEVSIESAAVGSSEPVAAYHEWGYPNVRTGKMVPARPAFRIGLEESVAPIMKMLESAIGVTLGLTEFTDEIGVELTTSETVPDIII